MHDQPAGWYRDPARPNLHRFWNGQRWIGPVGETLNVTGQVLEPDRC